MSLKRDEYHFSCRELDDKIIIRGGENMMQKNKLKIIKMFAYLVIYILMILVFFILYNRYEDSMNSFEFPSIVLHISPAIMILFGILLNFERIIELINGKGKVSVDWLRLVIVVLPLTAISFLNLLQYRQLFDGVILTYYIRPPVVFVAQFLLGYLLVTCFSKKSELESKV